MISNASPGRPGISGQTGLCRGGHDSSCDLAFRIVLIGLLIFALPGVFLEYGAAATTTIHVTKYAFDDSTVLEEKTFSFRDLASMPALGDGKTHYYAQGPSHDEADLWNEDESKNIIDLGAVRGTDLMEIIKVSGNMVEGDVVEIKNESGDSRKLDYYNIFMPDSSQGQVVLAWSKDGASVDSGYSDGMRLVFFADTSTNTKKQNIFGNSDMGLNIMDEYWYKVDDKWPASIGYCLPRVTEIIIHSLEEPESNDEDIPVEEITDTPTPTVTTATTTTTPSSGHHTTTAPTTTNVTTTTYTPSNTAPTTLVTTVPHTTAAFTAPPHQVPENTPGSQYPVVPPDIEQTSPMDTIQVMVTPDQSLQNPQETLATRPRYDVPKPQGGSFSDNFWYLLWRLLNIFE